MDGTCPGSLSVLHSKLRLPAAPESIPAPRISGNCASGSSPTATATAKPNGSEGSEDSCSLPHAHPTYSQSHTHHTLTSTPSSSYISLPKSATDATQPATSHLTAPRIRHTSQSSYSHLNASLRRRRTSNHHSRSFHAPRLSRPESLQRPRERWTLLRQPRRRQCPPPRAVRCSAAAFVEGSNKQRSTSRGGFGRSCLAYINTPEVNRKPYRPLGETRRGIQVCGLHDHSDLPPEKRAMD